MTLDRIDLTTGEVLDVMTEADARRITERIRLTASNAREALEKLPRLIEEAKAGSAHVTLGYASWTAYLAAVLGEEPLRLPRDQRQEIVGYLAGEGLSTRAIASVVGASHQTVANDLAPVKYLTPLSDDTPEPPKVARRTIPKTPTTERAAPSGDMAPPEVEQRPTFGDDSPAPRSVVGLDGKTYLRAVPTPKPRDEEQENAEKAAYNLAHFLNIFAGLDSPTMTAHYRDAYLRGRQAVTPAQRELVTPDVMRAVASGLNRLADEWSDQ